MNKKIDIRSVRFVPKMSTTSKVIMDKKTKQKSRKYLNNTKNWEM